MSRKFTLISNTGYSTVSAVYIAFLQFLLVPVLISYLGIEQFGLIGIINIFTMLGYVTIFDFGISAAVAKFISEYISKKKFDSINSLVNSVLLLYIGIAIILAIVFLPLISLFTDSVFEIPSLYRDNFFKVFVLLVLSYIYQFPWMLMVSVLEGFQRFDILKGWHMVVESIKVASVYYLITTGSGFEVVVIANMIVPAILFVIYFISFSRVFDHYHFTGFSIKSIKEVASLSKYLFVGKISSVTINNSDRIIIGVFLSPIAMGSYDVLLKLPQLLNKFLGLANTAVIPMASNLAAQKETRLLKDLFHRGFRFYFGFVVPICSACIFYSQDFFRLWLGDEFEYLSPLLIVLLIWSLLTPFFYGGNILTGMNSGMKRLTILRWVQTFLKISVSLIFVFHYGLNAIVSSYLASYLVLFAVIKLYKDHIDFNMNIFLKDVFTIILSGLIPLSIFYILNLISYPILDNLIGLGILVLAWAFIQWVVILFITLDKEDRKTIVEIIQGKILKSSK